MANTGERLKKARLTKGISLEEAHKKTKIQVAVLKALEEDSPISLSAVYRRGFLKIYCNFLGLDFQEFLAEAPEKQQPPPPLSAKSETIVLPEQRVVQPTFLKQASKKLILLKPYLTSALAVRAALVVVALLVVVHGVRLISRIGRSVRKANTHNVVRPRAQRIPRERPAPGNKAPTADETAQEKSPVPAASAQSASASSQVTSGVRLGIRTRANSWIHLKLDGRTVFQGIMPKNRSENWQAQEKMELSLGNAGVVDLEVNGRLITQLGRRGQAVKNIVITKEGLTIPK